jgi:hypothetical protein
VDETDMYCVPRMRCKVWILALGQQALMQESQAAKLTFNMILSPIGSLYEMRRVCFSTAKHCEPLNAAAGNPAELHWRTLQELISYLNANLSESE